MLHPSRYVSENAFNPDQLIYHNALINKGSDSQVSFTCVSLPWGSHRHAASESDALGWGDAGAGEILAHERSKFWLWCTDSTVWWSDSPWFFSSSLTATGCLFQLQPSIHIRTEERREGKGSECSLFFPLRSELQAPTPLLVKRLLQLRTFIWAWVYCSTQQNLYSLKTKKSMNPE